MREALLTWLPGLAPALATAAGWWLLHRKHRRIERLVAHNEGVAAADARLLAEVARERRLRELAAFAMSEHGLWTHEVTDGTLAVLRELRSATQLPQTAEAWGRAEALVTTYRDQVRGRFQETFHCTPEEWVARARAAGQN